MFVTSHQPAEDRPALVRRRWLTLGAALLAFASLGATCENQDFSEIYVYEFEIVRGQVVERSALERCTAEECAGVGEFALETCQARRCLDDAVIRVFNAYDARTSVEFSLINTGQEAYRATLYARTITVTGGDDTDSGALDTGGASMIDASSPTDVNDEDVSVVDDATASDVASDTDIASDADVSSDIDPSEDTTASDATAMEDADAADDASVASDASVEDEGDVIEEIYTENVCIPLRGALNQDTVAGIKSLPALEPDESVSGRFGEDELVRGIGVELEIEVSCPEMLGEEQEVVCIPDGTGVLEFTVIAAQRECLTSNDCADNQTCDTSLGRCVGIECGPDLSCPNNQECDRATCRCNSSGCLCDVGGDRHAPMPAWGWALAALLALAAWTRRRREPRREARGAPGRARLLGVMLAASATCAVVGAASDAEARCPFISSSHDRGFDRPGAILYGGSEYRFLTGAIGEDAGSGLGLYVGQALQYRWFAFKMTLGTSYFLTTQDPPPIARGLQIYSVRPGGRLQCAIGLSSFGSLRPFFDVEYERVGIISNALVRQTGSDTAFNAFGGAVGVQYLPVPYFMIALRGSFAPFIDLQGGIASVGLTMGLVGNL